MIWLSPGLPSCYTRSTTRCRRDPSRPAWNAEVDFKLSADEEAFLDGLRAWLEIHCGPAAPAPAGGAR